MMSRREGAGLISEPDAEEDAMLVGLYLVRLDVRDICLDGAVDFGVTVICLRANAVLLIMKSDDLRKDLEETSTSKGERGGRVKTDDQSSGDPNFLEVFIRSLSGVLSYLDARCPTLPRCKPR